MLEDCIGILSDRVMMTDPSGRLESFIRAKLTGNAFEFCGIAPLVGRYTNQADAKIRAPSVFVLSYKLWQSRFAGDPSITGKSYVLNGVPTMLVGIMPKQFTLWGADLCMAFTPHQFMRLPPLQRAARHRTAWPIPQIKIGGGEFQAAQGDSQS